LAPLLKRLGYNGIMIPMWKLAGRLGNSMFQYAYLYAQARRQQIPDIYVQNEKFFKKYVKEIKAIFGEGIGYLPQVGIHVRRGDYVDNSFHTDLSATSYYDNAIAFFPDREFLVFSDDPIWCKQKFSDSKKFQIIEGQTDVEDMNMLASCEAQVIANSSFSWWAAYLCPNPARQVIAPREDRWFRDGVKRCILPKEWKQIDLN